MPWRRRRRLVDLDDYVYERCDQIHSLGGTVGDLATLEAAGEFAILGVVLFGRESECFLNILEIVRMEGDTAHRHKYSYHLQCGDNFMFRYERDPDGHPSIPVHKHLPPDERTVPWEPVTLSDVMDELWPAITDWEAEQPTEDEQE